MNQTIAYIIYYFLAIVFSVFLVDFFKASVFQALIIGLAVGTSFNVFVRPIIDLYTRK